MNIGLRRYYKETDLMFLYSLYQQNQSVFAITANDITDFEEELNWKLFLYYRDFFLIIDDEKKQCGCVFSYGYQPNDGHMMISQCVEKEARGKGIGQSALVKFIEIIFSYYSIKRIFVEFSGEQAFLHHCLEGLGFHKECVLKDYFCDKDVFYPKYTYSLVNKYLFTKK